MVVSLHQTLKEEVMAPLLGRVKLVGERTARRAITFGLFHSGLMNVNAWGWKYARLFGHMLFVCF